MKVRFVFAGVATAVMVWSSVASAQDATVGRWCRSLDRQQADYSIQCVMGAEQNTCTCRPDFVLYNPADFPLVTGGGTPVLASDNDSSRK